LTAVAVQSAFAFDKPRRRNIVIEAGAGTGKTTAIVAEVLRLLLGDEALSPERIVLVTFTEKAAGEIADRIHQALTELSLLFEFGESVSWPIGSATPLFEVPSGQRDSYHRACVAQLGRIESLRSQTIHSFCQNLLRQFPIEAGLDPQFTIVEGFERALLYGELYDAWVDDETRLHPTDEAKRDWEVLLEHVGYLFLVRIIILPLLDRRDLLLDDTYNLGALDLIEHELLIAIEKLRGCDSVPGICDYLREHRPPPRGSSIELWLEYLRPIANEIRITDLPRGKANDQFKQPLRVLRASDKKGNSVYDQLSSHRAAVSLLALTRRFAAFLEQEKRKRGVVDFDDLLLRTQSVLADPAVLRRAREQFDFIFVDEFQDTDRVQANIIDLLARDANGAVVDGRTVIVGDPKQSIYGFRRADLETYGAFTRGLLSAGAEHRKLEMQFRSTPQLLTAINAIFAYVFPETDPDPNVFRPVYHRLTAARNDTARDASVTFLDAPVGDDREDRFVAEAEAIAAWIQERGGDLREYALLLRRTTKLDDYLDVFDRRGIRYVLPATRLFLDRPAPVDLLAVLRGIAFPFDRGAEVSAARTPYFALTDTEIALGSDAYQQFASVLESLRSASRHLTVAQLIDLVIGTCRIEDVYAATSDGKRSLRHLEHVRAIAFAYDQRVGGSVRQFVSEISRRRAQPDEMEPSLADDADDAIRILTVHTAKGLEFDTVILPDLEFPSPPPNIFLVDEPRSLVLTGQVETLSASDTRSGRKSLKEIGKEREEAETRRLFYVAVTRAKDEVVFVAGAPYKNGFYRYVDEVFNPASIAWPDGPSRTVRMVTIGSDTIPIAFERVTGEGAGVRTRRRLADASLEAELATLPIVEPSFPPPAALPAILPRGEVLTRRASAQKRAAGILLHRILEIWDGRTPVEPLLKSVTAEQGADAATATLVRKRLGVVTKSDTFRRITNAELLGREVPLLTPNGERRIDRLAREGDDDLVVDYKSGQPSEERVARDRKQVADYCGAMSGITNRPCKGLVWYIDVDVDRAIEVTT
jgi:ATP-dependent helicase/nuclease subunit A